MGCVRQSKDYKSKIIVFHMYMFQWFQQNTVMTISLLICGGCLIYFFLTPDDFNEVYRQRKQNSVGSFEELLRRETEASPTHSITQRAYIHPHS